MSHSLSVLLSLEPSPYRRGREDGGHQADLPAPLPPEEKGVAHRGESTGCVPSRCLLTRPPARSPARRPGSQFGLSVQPSSALGPGALLPIHGPQQRPVLSKLPGKKAALSPWPSSPCGAQCVSLLRHSLPACAGGASSPRNVRPVQITLVLLRCRKPLVRVCSPFSPLFGLILSDARSSHEVTPPQTFPLVSMRSLLHLLGLRLFKGAGTVYPRDTLILLLPKQIPRQAPSPCSPSLLSLPPPFSTCLYSCLNRAFPGCMFSEGAACLPQLWGAETWAKFPLVSQQSPGLWCSVAPRAQTCVWPQWLTALASVRW